MSWDDREAMPTDLAGRNRRPFTVWCASTCAPSTRPWSMASRAQACPPSCAPTLRAISLVERSTVASPTCNAKAVSVPCWWRSRAAAWTGKDDLGFCDGTCDSTGACKKKQGQACLKTADCARGIPCVDGYCCDKACTGSCEACDVFNSLGTCTTLVADATPHANHPVCAATDATCAGKCSGKSAACSYSTTACRTASRAGKSYQAAGTCDNGACQTPDPQMCTNVCVLSAGGCKDCTPSAKQCSAGGAPQLRLSDGTWQDQTTCGAGTTCFGGSCANKISNGGACPVGHNDACQSGNCSSGLCCPVSQSNSGGICCGNGLTNSNGVCCAAGQTGCNGTCVDLQTNGLHCGSCTRSCNGLNCCSGTCVDTSVSLSNCGGCGNSCGGTCLGGSCCAGAGFSCGTSSGCGAWNFETGTQGAVFDPASASDNGGSNIAWSSTRANPSGGGRYSIAIPTYLGAGGGDVVDVIFPLCTNGNAVNVGSYTLSMSVFFAGDPYPAYDKSTLIAVGADDTWVDTGNPGTHSLSSGTWIQLSGQLTGSGLATAVGLHVAPSPAEWSGTIYIDDVVLTAP